MQQQTSANGQSQYVQPDDAGSGTILSFPTKDSNSQSASSSIMRSTKRMREFRFGPALPDFTEIIQQKREGNRKERNRTQSPSKFSSSQTKPVQNNGSKLEILPLLTQRLNQSKTHNTSKNESQKANTPQKTISETRKTNDSRQSRISADIELLFVDQPTQPERKSKSVSIQVNLDKHTQKRVNEYTQSPKPQRANASASVNVTPEQPRQLRPLVTDDASEGDLKIEDLISPSHQATGLSPMQSASRQNTINFDQAYKYSDQFLSASRQETQTPAQTPLITPAQTPSQTSSITPLKDRQNVEFSNAMNDQTPKNEKSHGNSIRILRYLRKNVKKYSEISGTLTKQPSEHLIICFDEKNKFLAVYYKNDDCLCKINGRKGPDIIQQNDVIKFYSFNKDGSDFIDSASKSISDSIDAIKIKFDDI